MTTHSLRNGRLMAATLSVLIAALYAVLAIRRHLTLHTGGFDLGIFEQAIRNYSKLQPPIAILKGPGYNLLGDHFHPILAALAPIYAVFPSPLTLLGAQSVLFGIAAYPLVTWGHRALGPRTALAVGVVFGLSFGMVSAAAFDFHEIAFAVPLISFSVCAFGQRRFRRTAVFAIPLVLVKEDLGISVVAVIGVLIAVQGRRRLGIAVALVGVAASLIELFVLLPLANTVGGYDYWTRLGSGGSIVTNLSALPLEKLGTTLLTVAITGFLALFSPLALAAIPTLGWRFISNDSNYWGTGFHYSAVLMPIMVAAMIDGMVRLKSRESARSRVVARLGLAASLIVAVAVVPFHPLAQLASLKLWTANPQQRAVDRAFALIPDNATVSASDNLIPQLTSRDDVTFFGLAPLSTVRPEWIVTDSQSTRHYRVTRAKEKRDVRMAIRSGYTVVLRQGAVTLLKRPGG
ncbi:DUF2079 domain-containing protein [soil metagenome]